jgi:PQQ-dependent dehydrogenase (methanol/ethanol family)
MAGARVMPAGAQGGPTAQAGRADWALHNLDLRNSRYSPLNEINVSNAGKLAVKWSFEVPEGDTIREVTPLVIDGVMYFHSGSKLFAVDAVTGKSRWTFQTEQPFSGGGRGPAYGDGRIYAFGRSVVYAVDAKTGTLVESFGNKGLLRIVNDALNFKYSDKYPPNLDPTSIGYSMTNPPTYFNGTLYVGVPLSEGLPPGGLVIAADGKTGAIKWVFNTIPQGPRDDGWEIAKDTWSGSSRYGAGVWTQPAIDPELGLIYFNAANPSPDYDGSSRKGINLFSNTIIALNLATGKLAWYYQVLHHDIWDWDLVTGPTLFDVKVDGRTVKGLASLAKTCYVYILNRETGQPINPIVETAVPTNTDVAGEEVWPTQPIPYTSRGMPQQPFCTTYPIVTDPELAKRVRPSFHPFLVDQLVITAPGLTGGPNFGSSSFSPRTGLLYVTGKNDAHSIRVKPVGDTLEPGPANLGHFGNFTEAGKTGVIPTGTLAAYDPATGQQAWYVELASSNPNGIAGGVSGNLVTAGDVVFQGISSGEFYAFDARSSKQVFKLTAKAGIRASPMTYQVNGKQYVSVVATNTILTLALP